MFRCTALASARRSAHFDAARTCVDRQPDVGGTSLLGGTAWRHLRRGPARCRADRAPVLRSQRVVGALQRPEFGLKKPPSYNWDFALLGVSVFLTGLLGLPPNYGLIPQAPLHVRALADVRVEPDGALTREVWVSVCETRASAAGAAALTLALLSPPGLAALGRVPLGVLAGQFLYLAAAGAAGNGLAERAVFLAMDPATDVRAPYARLSFWRAVFFFTALQLCAVALIFGVTLSPAGVIFPVLIVLLVPARVFLLPRLFSAADLTILDPMQPASGSGRPPPDDLAVLDAMESAPGRLLTVDSPISQHNSSALASAANSVRID